MPPRSRVKLPRIDRGEETFGHSDLHHRIDGQESPGQWASESRMHVARAPMQPANRRGRSHSPGYRGPSRRSRPEVLAGKDDRRRTLEPQAALKKSIEVIRNALRTG